MTHSPEPWRVAEFAGKLFVDDCHGGYVTQPFYPGDVDLNLPIWRANMERIVACVNFLEGISTSDLLDLLADPDVLCDAKNSLREVLEKDE